MHTQAIVVLGFTLNPDQSIPLVLKNRLEKCREFYSKGVKVIVCGKGTPKAFTKGQEVHKTEAEAMSNYLKERGVLNEDLFLEKRSMSTLTNAYYSFVDFISKMNVDSLKVVSNEFHMPSVKYCFNLIYGKKYHIEFITSSDEGLDEKNLTLWKIRIQRMLDEAYPILFKDVSEGDIESISKIINEAISETPSSKIVAFEKVLADIAGIKNSQDLKGII